LLELFHLEKAFCEVRYELEFRNKNNRPGWDWVSSPLGGCVKCSHFETEGVPR
jgi:predicted trehalose synthase